MTTTYRSDPKDLGQAGEVHYSNGAAAYAPWYTGASQNAYSSPPPPYTPGLSEPTVVASPAQPKTSKGLLKKNSCSAILCVLVFVVVGGAIGLWRAWPYILRATQGDYTYQCATTQFQCSGSCISQSWTCDGEKDCANGEDESLATCGRIVTTVRPRTGPVFYNTTKPCDGVSRFKCSNANDGCIPISWVCDGHNDCGDNSDEENCDCDTSKEYSCLLGETKCISKSKMCDGKYDCPYSRDIGTSEDERFCSAGFCSSDEFKCTNTGRCIPKSWACDGHDDCGDFSDEKNCKCSIIATRCADDMCVALSSWCDGLKDCRDGSDEVVDCHKSCPNGGTRCVASGVCMNFKQLCDRIVDCPDGSDEANCGGCQEGEYQCSDMKCIDKKWLCDGTPDCSSGEDETLSQCNKCSSERFQCVNGNPACLAASQECDGNIDCQDASDEAACVYLNKSADGGLLVAKYKGIADYVVCTDNWNKAWADMACQQMGFSASTTVGSIAAPPGRTSLGVPSSKSSESINLLSHLRPNSSCAASKVVSLTCAPLGCGQRQVPTNQTGPYVVNGFDASPGAWPWQVSIFYDSNKLCGGSIIADKWIITAAHCSIEYKNVGLLSVRAGSTKLTGSDSNLQELVVDRVYTNARYEHSEWRNVFINDVGLLRLKNRIKFNDFVQPICLSTSGVNLDRFKVCVATGFGRVRSDGAVSSNLRQGKLKLLSTDECFDAFKYLAGDSWGASRDDFRYMLCAGNNPPIRGVDICQGDSGGPLACLDQKGVWSLVGITSFVVSECQLSVFARASEYFDWVKRTVE